MNFSEFLSLQKKKSGHFIYLLPSNFQMDVAKPPKFSDIQQTDIEMPIKGEESNKEEKNTVAHSNFFNDFDDDFDEDDLD